MRKGLFLLIITLILNGCLLTRNKTVVPDFREFRVTISQDGLLREITNHEVKLAKKPFSIIIHLTGMENIFVNASFLPDSFNAAMEGSPLDEIEGFKETEITEELFNKKELLVLSHSSPHFWHYVNENEHRFSSVIQREGYIICERKISAIMNQTGDQKAIDISSMTEDTIYLVMMKMEWSADYSRRIERKREYIKLNFSDFNPDPISAEK